MIKVLLLCLSAMLASGTALAQAWPSKQLRIIVPFTPGGFNDTLARILAAELPKTLGQPVVVENRPGAGGTIAAKAVAGAVPDGYTIMLATSGSLAISSQLYKTAGYDPRTSFAAIALISSTPQILAVTPQLPVHSVAELVAYAKANPGKLNYGASTGTPPHLHGEMFKVLTGTDIVFVPYRSANKATIDVLAGQLQLTFEGTTGIMPYLLSGKVRPLAISNPERIPELPNLPTMIESGLHGMPSNAWQGIVAPAGTPPAIVEKLNTVINEELRSPELMAKLAKLGGSPKPLTPQEFSAFIAAEMTRWAVVIKATGVHVD